MRLAPNFYSIDDMEAIKIIYGHGTNFIKVRLSLLHPCSLFHNIYLFPHPHPRGSV